MRSPTPWNHPLVLAASPCCLPDAAGEEVLRRSGVPYTIVRPGGLSNDPAGQAQLVVAQARGRGWGIRWQLGQQGSAPCSTSATWLTVRLAGAGLLCMPAADHRAVPALARAGRQGQRQSEPRRRGGGLRGSAVRRGGQGGAAPRAAGPEAACCCSCAATVLVPGSYSTLCYCPSLPSQACLQPSGVMKPPSPCSPCCPQCRTSYLWPSAAPPSPLCADPAARNVTLELVSKPAVGQPAAPLPKQLKGLFAGLQADAAAA